MTSPSHGNRAENNWPKQRSEHAGRKRSTGPCSGSNLVPRAVLVGLAVSNVVECRWVDQRARGEQGETKAVLSRLQSVGCTGVCRAGCRKEYAARGCLYSIGQAHSFSSPVSLHTPWLSTTQARLDRRYSFQVGYVFETGREDRERVLSLSFSHGPPPPTPFLLISPPRDISRW